MKSYEDKMQEDEMMCNRKITRKLKNMLKKNLPGRSNVHKCVEKINEQNK